MSVEWITEESESDTRTSYPVTAKVWEGSTGACESVLIADSAVFGRMLFLDGELQSASADEHIYHETLVHPVMAASAGSGQTPRVLVVGGGEGATVREVLKWNPSAVDWVDIDGELVTLCRNHLRWADDVYAHPNVRYMNTDIREALPTLGLYDVIILDLPDPDGDTGYLYSDNFWYDIKSHLDPDGRIVSHCGPVRPFGDIGGGFQRLRGKMGIAGFYSQMIPSFQSEWGFIIWKASGQPFVVTSRLPPSLRIVDRAQLAAWESPAKLWLIALASQ